MYTWYNVTSIKRWYVTYLQPERLSPVLEVLHWTIMVRYNRWFSAFPNDLKYRVSRS